jgi:hypothetical protein
VQNARAVQIWQKNTHLQDAGIKDWPLVFGKRMSNLGIRLLHPLAQLDNCSKLPQIGDFASIFVP